jgi:hypothetical protein
MRVPTGLDIDRDLALALPVITGAPPGEEIPRAQSWWNVVELLEMLVHAPPLYAPARKR